MLTEPETRPPASSIIFFASIAAEIRQRAGEHERLAGELNAPLSLLALELQTGFAQALYQVAILGLLKEFADAEGNARPNFFDFLQGLHGGGLHLSM